MTTLDQTHLSTWVGKTETLSDKVTLVPAQAMVATLDLENFPLAAGSALPLPWSWLYFLPTHRQSQVGPDGHPQRGGFLPPVPLPRRMWAGSRMQFHQPLVIGEDITRVSRIAKISFKEGRSGALVFVTVQHETSGARGLAISEAQDLVYRDHPQPGEPAPAAQAAPSDATFTRQIVPDPVLLFRFSALTLNGHRIHYDRPYATEVEAYAGLVVHGPLIATFLLDHLRRAHPQVQVTHFDFRAVRPILDTAPFLLNGRISDDGKSVRLWASNAEGALCMDATATVSGGL